MNYRLGIDIGITSVGWGLVDADGNVKDAGVRLFKEAVNDENVNRRVKRGMRRRIRRRKHRLERVKDLLIGNGIVQDDFDFQAIGEITPYEIRVKGLTQKLEKQELAIALYHLVKRRGMRTLDGISAKEDAPDETLSTKAIIARTKSELDDESKYICQIQLERLKAESSQVRGINNRFMTEHYEKEARKILVTQKQFTKEITEEFTEKYMGILSARREYFEGPGFGSPYGWKDTEEWMDKLVGRCSYFPSEKRIVKRAYTAELFNLLNDLNNLKVNGEHLTKEQKEDLIENTFKKQKTISAATVKKLAERLDSKMDELSGYRINKKGEPEFTELIGYHAIAKANDKSSDKIDLNDRDVLDEISRILTYYQTKTHAKDKLITELKLKEESAEAFSDILEEKNNPFLGTHSLSKKAIEQVLDDLWETDKNQMQLFFELGLRAHKLKELKGRKRIPTSHVDDWILSPVVKRSVKQSIKVINAIIEKHGLPENITIELAREKNSDDKKKYINQIQKENEAINKEVKDIIASNKLGDRLFEKVKLWLLQDGKCMYSLQNITIDDLVYHSENFEVDHIIPRSVSFDDSMSNKPSELG